MVLLAGAALVAAQDGRPASEPSTKGIQIFGTVRSRHGDTVPTVDRTALLVREGGTFASVEKLKEPHPGSYCVAFDLNDEGDWMFELQSNIAAAVMDHVVSPNHTGSLVFATARIEMPARNLTARQVRQRIRGSSLLREANAQGEPPIYATMQECIDELTGSPRKSGPRVMFVFTGQRGPALVKINDLARRSIEAGVLIYMMHIARGDTANSRTYAILARAAVGTGGMAFEVTSKTQSDSIAHEIEDDFVNGYEFCYVPSSKRDNQGGLHPFEVTSSAYKVNTPAAYPDPAANRSCLVH